MQSYAIHDGMLRNKIVAGNIKQDQFQWIVASRFITYAPLEVSMTRINCYVNSFDDLQDESKSLRNVESGRGGETWKKWHRERG